MMKKNNELDEKWLYMFYDRVTDQFSLSRRSFHNTHQWANTLTFGIVTAILTLFREENSYPNEVGFIALLLTLPLMLRFFIRSCLEYSIQRKWQIIRDNLDKYFLNNKRKSERIELIKSIQKYYFERKSPVSIWKIICDNLKLAYSWPFLIYIGLIIWGALKLQMSTEMLISSVFVSIYVFYELITFFCYSGFKLD
jgi:hypothetical protein